jgi:hypothetical protein
MTAMALVSRKNPLPGMTGIGDVPGSDLAGKASVVIDRRNAETGISMTTDHSEW